MMVPICSNYVRKVRKVSLSNGVLWQSWKENTKTVGSSKHAVIYFLFTSLPLRCFIPSYLQWSCRAVHLKQVQTNKQDYGPWQIA